MRTCFLTLLAAVVAGACNKNSNATQPPSNVELSAQATGHGAGLIPEHGGVVGTSAGLVSEVVTQPDGKLLAYVRGPQGPVADATVQVTLRNQDGTARPVAVAWDGSANAYVGYVWGVQPGSKTVDVAVVAQPGAPAQTVSSQLNVSAVATPPRSRYGGTVEIIGQYAVEVVPARSGEVAFFVMDMQGNPVPSADVELPRVTVAASGSASAPSPVISTQRVGDHFVVRGEPSVLAAAPSVGLNVDLNVRGQSFTHAVVPAAPVIAVMPPAIAVAASAPTVAVQAAVPNLPTSATVRAIGAVVPAVPNVQVHVAAPTPPAVAVGARVGVAAPAVAVPHIAVPAPVIAAGSVRAGASVQSVVPARAVAVGVAAQPASVRVAAPVVVAAGGGTAHAGAQGFASARVGVNIPAPPPPPAVHVQGGFSVGGGIGIH